MVSQLSHTESPKYRMVGHLWVDFAAAASSATLVAPAVAIIDRVVVEKAASNRSVLKSLRTHLSTAIFHPRKFFISKPFFVVWLLYAGTYSAANASETVLSQCPPGQLPTSTSIIKFLFTFLVNVPLGLYKDVNFAQAFGGDPKPGIPSPGPSCRMRPPARAVPMTTFSLFLLRDGLTVGGSFILPSLVSQLMPDTGVSQTDKNRIIAQFAIPASIQLVTTPIHLLGLDLYNRERALVSERLTRVQRDWAPASLTRVFRILPAFSFGVLANMQLRNQFRGLLDGETPPR